MASNSDQESDTNERQTKAAVSLSRRLDGYYFDRLKLVCSAGVLGADYVRDITEFSSLFNALKQTMSPPDKAIVFCCQVLKRLGYRVQDEFRNSACCENDFDYQREYPKVDCMLTVLEFLGNLRDQDFSIIQAYLSNKTRQSKDRLPTRLSVAKVMFDEGLISENNLTFVLKLSKQFNRKHMFTGYLQRLGQRLNTADEVMRDGGGKSVTSSNQPNPITNPIEEQTPDRRERVQEWVNQTQPPSDTMSTISSIPDNDTCTTLSTIGTETTAPYAVSEHQVDVSFNPGGGNDELVLNQQREGSQQSQAAQINKEINLEQLIKSLSSNAFVTSKLLALGQKLEIDEAFLSQLISKDRSIAYKVEELLYKWKDSGCSEVSITTISRVLMEMGLTEAEVYDVMK